MASKSKTIVPLTILIYRDGQLIKTESVEREIVKIGSHAASHILITDELGSPIHAAIDTSKGPHEVTLTDLGSTNGTIVNGEKITSCLLQSGQEIVIGNTRLVVELGESTSVAVKAKKTSYLRWLGLSLVVFGPFIWIFAFCGTEVEGRFQARGELGSWTLEPDQCEAGGRRGFHGVTLWSSEKSQIKLRLVEEPSGKKVVSVFKPGLSEPVIISLAECEEADLELEQMSVVSADKVHNMKGSVSLKCQELEGRASFTYCDP